MPSRNKAFLKNFHISLDTHIHTVRQQKCQAPHWEFYKKHTIWKVKAQNLQYFFISSVRSSSVYHSLFHTQHPLFQISQIWSNPAYIHSLFTFPFIQCSINRTELGNTFAWITLTTHACTNFFKILQGSSDFSKTQHVLYFLNAWGSMISNMT